MLRYLQVRKTTRDRLPIVTREMAIELVVGWTSMVLVSRSYGLVFHWMEVLCRMREEARWSSVERMDLEAVGIGLMVRIRSLMGKL